MSEIKLFLFKVVIVIMAGGLVLLGSLAFLFYADDSFTYADISDGTCNIAVLKIQGQIVPFADPGYYEVDASYVRSFLEQAASEWEIEGVVVEIDSYGGTAVAAEDIADLIRTTELPTVSLIRESAVSAGYLVATGAEHIIASPFSDVGGIGITMSYVEYSDRNRQDGDTFISLSSAPFKDYLNPNKELTNAERELLERDLSIWHDYFIDLVQDYRNLERDQVVAVADGSSLPGALALDAGLIDQLGNRQTARETLAQKLDLETSDVILCS